MLRPLNKRAGVFRGENIVKIIRDFGITGIVKTDDRRKMYFLADDVFKFQHGERAIFKAQSC